LKYSFDALAVCEDAITIKNDASGDQTWIIGGGAYKAADKVVQHNGCGTVNIIVSRQTSFYHVCVQSLRIAPMFCTH